MNYLPAIFSLIVAAAGWFYIFYSKAAVNLAHIEQSDDNRLRVRLRRIGGVVMILLAVAFYLGFVAIERHNALAAVSLLLAVLIMMVIIVALGLIDLRLTSKLKNRPTDKQDPP